MSLLTWVLVQIVPAADCRHKAMLCCTRAAMGFLGVPTSGRRPLLYLEAIFDSEQLDGGSIVIAL